MVQTAPTQKTKAKARYLKAKRDRRKKRLKTVPSAADAPARVRGVQPESEPSSSDYEEETEKKVVPSIQQGNGQSTEQIQEVVMKSKKKHRKRTPSPSGSEMGEPNEELTAPSFTTQPHSTSSPNLPTLPSFPLPTQPAPPSKATLALQGLDRAILEAEIIDPASSALVPRPGSTDSTCLELDDRMRERLMELGIENLFAVQTVLLPFLLTNRALHCPYDPPQDACVSAPTGSGKTLAYVVPITQILSSRIVTRLRALVVLPTRDLVTQVRETFEAVAKGRGLKIAVATGQHSFAHEQSQLVYALPSIAGPAPQYHSKVDVLICTPGRLTDHLRGTLGFTLEHLRFLVIDEADRLITQSFQDWLAHVLDATQPPPSEFPPTELDEPQSSSCQKLLFSATLTHDPSKIVPLGLRDPRYFVVGEQASAGVGEETFAFPASLSEHMCVCSPAQKPLVFFHLIHTHDVRNALVFTKSAESTARLVQLFGFFEAARGAKEKSLKPVVMQAYSSDLSGTERKNVIERFRQGGIDLLVCSDLVARGVDISHVTHVVSYDAPVDLRKYVHRVGRTARAGRSGDAWSLVEDQEARYFKQMLRNAGHLDSVKKLKVKESNLAQYQKEYEANQAIVEAATWAVLNAKDEIHVTASLLFPTTSTTTMEISPAKSLEVISDSEGEEDHTRATGLLNQPQRDPNAEILAVSRDRRHHQTPATMSSHIPSSHISQFPTMSHGQPPTPSVGSSIQPGSDLAATNPRPRPRPRMRPVPPPDEPDTSIGTFSTIPPSLAQPPTDTVSSFGNSVVQDVPHMRPPSLPPSSLPTVDSSSSMLHPTFPVTPAPQAKAKPASKSKTSNPTNPTIDSILSNPVPPPTIPMETSAFPSSKRVKPKMRPPPPPEASPSISTTAPSVAATDSSSNLKTNPSTSATSNSANSKTSSALQRSALDEAEEYTGRGARRLAQASKPKAEEYIDVGGPEDEVILLLDSSDAERPPAKPKPKQKKKAAPKPSNKSTPPEPEVPGAHDPRSSSRTTPATTNRSKRKSPQLQTSDDEFGRWDVPIPGEPSSASTQVTSTKKRRKAAASYSDDEGDNPPFPSHAPDTATLPGNPSNLPPPPAPSSPLSSPGHSPAAKRKLEASTVDESSAPTTSKKPRKSAGTMEIVLRVPAVQASSSKKSKAKPKGKGKAALDAAVEPSGAERNPSTFPIPEVGTETTPGLIPEPDKAGVTSQSADGGTNSEAINDPTGADLAVAEPETAPSTGKKPAKKKATKGKKGAAAAAAAASEVIATEEEKETATTATKKPAKGKGKSKAKAKDVDTTASPSDAGVPPAMPDATSNPDNGVAASSSNPGASGNPAPGSSNSSAQNQTPVPKASRPKPRHSTTPAPMPVAMGASGALLQSTGRKSSDRSLADTLRLTLGGTGTPSPRMGLSRRGSSKIAPLLAFRGAPPPPPPPMPKKPVRKKKGQSDDEDSEEGPEWEKLTEKQKEKKRREKEIAGWYSD